MISWLIAAWAGYNLLAFFGILGTVVLGLPLCIYFGTRDWREQKKAQAYVDAWCAQHRPGKKPPVVDRDGVPVDPNFRWDD